MTDMEWIYKGRCWTSGAGAWFPGVGETSTDAKQVCNGDPEAGWEPCPVREQCLAHAVENREMHGVWGGLSANERRALTTPRCRYCSEPLQTSDPRIRYCSEPCRKAGREQQKRMSEQRRDRAA